VSTAVLNPASDLLNKPFIESTQAVFSMMLGCKVVPGTPLQIFDFKSSHDISGIIGFSGALQGTVVISLDQEVAFSASEVFLGDRPVAINDEVIDMVGELANMIGGNAKERMPLAGISLGLPTVISGKGHCVSFEPGALVELMPFETPWGPLTVEVGLRLPKA
jgi:chemotaxis protein CheX